MSYREIRLEHFEFPPELPNDRANFRIVFDLRYLQGSEAKARPRQVTAIAPGVDTFWECDTGRADKANFVRARRGPRSWLPAVDMALLDDWARTIVLLQADEVLAVRAKVFDIDRNGFWDAVADVAGDLFQGVVATAGRRLSSTTPRDLRGATGDAVDEIGSYLAKKLAGGADGVLFQGSARPTGDRIVISGPGTNGRKKRGLYRIELSIRQGDS